LALIKEMFGEFPKDFVKESKIYTRYFDDNYNLIQLRSINNTNIINRLKTFGIEYKERREIADFLDKMVCVEPKKKKTPK
jgi:hypothetical protein